MKAAKEILFGGNYPVPKYIAVCPECGSQLIAESMEWIEKTGQPTIGGLTVDCRAGGMRPHRFYQSDWQGVINQVEKWCGAMDN